MQNPPAVNQNADNCQEFLTGRNIPMMNENAISNILIDVDFLEDELKRIDRAHLCAAFAELRSVRTFFLPITGILTLTADNIYSSVKRCARIPRACQ
jgi:hypothetical protein